MPIINRLMLLTIMLCCFNTHFAVLAQTSSSEDDEVVEGEEEEVVEAPPYSGFLPVIFVNTVDSVPITSREEYLPGEYWIDPMGQEGLDSIGSPEAMLPLEIRGRGHSSWNSQKKPYKLKLAKKTSWFGLPKNKHWALLNYDDMKYYNYGGFEIGRRIGLGWQPHVVAVELVLNGQYEGMYYLSETIRIDTGRLDIYEQLDGETNPDIIPYGWLLEIDNYDDPYQITIPETPTQNISFTLHSPELISEEQSEWLTNEMSLINSLIYTPDKTDNSWEDYIDATSMAKYFLIHELTDNVDGFLGSFYLHKDSVENAKWVCGPLWDMVGMNRQRDNFTVYSPGWDGNPYTPRWIRELLKFPKFVNTVREVWNQYFDGDFTELFKLLDNFGANQIKADPASNKRWQGIYYFSSYTSKYKTKTWLKKNYTFLNTYINNIPSALSIILAAEEVHVGDTIQLEAYVYPTNAIDPVVWSSSDPLCAAVTSDGKLCALEPGPVTITVTSGELSDSIDLTIQNKTSGIRGLSGDTETSHRGAPNAFTLYDLTGRKVYQGARPPATMPDPGIYILKTPTGSHKIAY